MGVDIVCDENRYSCGYQRWNKFRVGVIQATFRYIETVLKPTENPGIFLKELLEYSEIVRVKQADQGLDSFLSTQQSNIVESNIVDIFIHFGLGGLFVLCNKTDCGGCYSVGNSVDICELFEKIGDYIDDEFPQWEQIRDVFQESVEKNIIVLVL